MAPVTALPPTVRALVEQFAREIAGYKSPAYLEAQLRQEFVNPLFGSLGWDMANQQRLPLAFREVVHEESLRVGGGNKAPDYAFRLGGEWKFFVETKRPAEDLRGGIRPALQLRRYCWSAGLPLGVLTDFEEFAIYDTTIQPTDSDPAELARLKYIRFDEYEDRWDEIEGVFSKAAVIDGRFDTFAGGDIQRHRGEAIGGVFLQQIEGWRELLAIAIRRDNTGLSAAEISFTVQLILDRIVFLRIAEDRGLEPGEQLRTVSDGDDVFAGLTALFLTSDDRYNSGLFHLRDRPGQPSPPDTLTPSLTIRDEPLQRLIRELYFPISPFEFSVISADVLGAVYEQFLGHVIEIDDDGRMGVVVREEIRKAGGVYYTPDHVVEVMLQATLDELLKNKRPDGVEGLKVLDPACGSGSFLIAAYEHLLAWHLRWYNRYGVRFKKYADRIAPDPDGGVRLAPGERKRILLTNIFGVDIDPQAVEVTKLNLLLKLLEGESRQSIDSQLHLFAERALPDLAGNIRCGNSLVSSDFFAEEQASLLAHYDMKAINPFDWEHEFPKVFNRVQRGFDIVIGNPPYIFGEYLDERVKEYFASNYALAEGQYDTYKLFLERGLSLTGEGGRFSFIVPDAVLARDEAAPTRELLLREGLEAVFHCGQVFSVGVSAVVLVVAKGSQPHLIGSYLRDGRLALKEHDCSATRFASDPGYRLLVHATDSEADVIARMGASGDCLGDVVSISRGEEIGRSSLRESGPNPLLVGGDVSQFFVGEPRGYVNRLTKNRDIYRSPKIVVVKTGSRCVAALEENDLATMQSLYNLHVTDESYQLEALLGIINSGLVDFYIRRTFTDYKLLFPQLNQTTLATIPLPSALIGQQQPLVKAVRYLMQLKMELADLADVTLREVLEREATAKTEEIDRLVTGLYGLTPAEATIALA